MNKYAPNRRSLLDKRNFSGDVRLCEDVSSMKWRVHQPQVSHLDLAFTMQWPPAASDRDLIRIENLRVEANVGPDCWNRSRPQPLLISLALEADVRQAAQNDDLTNSPNYGKLAKEIQAIFRDEPDRVYQGMEALAEVVAKLAVTKLANPSYSVKVSVKAPKLLLHDTIPALEIDRSTDTSDQWGEHWKWSIDGWKVPVLIGINPPEREAKQIVIIDLQLFVRTGFSGPPFQPSLPQVVDRLLEVFPLLL
jgi:FolB domain-containing protein